MTFDVNEDKIINFSAGLRDPEDEYDRKRRVAFNFDIPETKEVVRDYSYMYLFTKTRSNLLCIGFTAYRLTTQMPNVTT